MESTFEIPDFTALLARPDHRAMAFVYSSSSLEFLEVNKLAYLAMGKVGTDSRSFEDFFDLFFRSFCIQITGYTSNNQIFLKTVCLDFFFENNMQTCLNWKQSAAFNFLLQEYFKLVFPCVDSLEYLIDYRNYPREKFEIYFFTAYVDDFSFKKALLQLNNIPCWTNEEKEEVKKRRDALTKKLQRIYVKIIELAFGRKNTHFCDFIKKVFSDLEINNENSKPFPKMPRNAQIADIIERVKHFYSSRSAFNAEFNSCANNSEGIRFAPIWVRNTFQKKDDDLISTFTATASELKECVNNLTNN